MKGSIKKIRSNLVLTLTTPPQVKPMVSTYVPLEVIKLLLKTFPRVFLFFFFFI